MRLYYYCRLTAVVHCVAAAAMIGIAASGLVALRIKTTKQVGWWFLPPDLPAVNTTALGRTFDLGACPLAPDLPARRPQYRTQQLLLEAGDISVPWLIVTFHLLSAVSQFAAAFDQDRYYHNISHDGALAHLVEYTLSAPLMMVAMCAQFGVADAFVIALVAVCCAGCMVLGVLSELMHMDGRKAGTYIGLDITPRVFVPAHWVAHAAGWALLATSFAAMLSNLRTFQTCGDLPVPEWVAGLAYSELALFSLFGFVQMASFIWPNTVRTEAAYITLSLTAKLLLGVTIFTGNYVGK